MISVLGGDVPGSATSWEESGWIPRELPGPPGRMDPVPVAWAGLAWRTRSLRPEGRARPTAPLSGSHSQPSLNAGRGGVKKRFTPTRQRRNPATRVRRDAPPFVLGGVHPPRSAQAVLSPLWLACFEVPAPQPTGQRPTRESDSGARAGKRAGPSLVRAPDSEQGRQRGAGAGGTA